MLGREGRRREEEVVGGAADVGAGLVRSKRVGVWGGREEGDAGRSLTRGEKGGAGGEFGVNFLPPHWSTEPVIGPIR